jgi:hypothetical protein
MFALVKYVEYNYFYITIALERFAMEGFAFKKSATPQLIYRLVQPAQLFSMSEKQLGVGHLTKHSYSFIVQNASLAQVAASDIIPEFFSRQLQEVDVTDSFSILEFCNSYGIPLSPFYNSASRFAQSAAYSTTSKRMDFDRDDRENIAPCEQADSAAAKVFLHDALRPRVFHTTQLSIAAQFYVQQRKTLKAGKDNKGFIHAGIVSLDEVADTIRLLQNATVLVSAVDCLDDPMEVLAYVNSVKHRKLGGESYFLDDFTALRHSKVDKAVMIGRQAQAAYDFLSLCRRWTEGQEYMNPTYLIASAFFSVFEDPALWHVCENTSCERIFKFHEGTNDKTRASRFCRLNCAKIQSRRNKLASIEYNQKKKG